MGWKCAPQVMGLVRDEPKPGQKHRANGRKIAIEAGYERASKSDTLDRSRSHLNEYTGFQSGEEFWDQMEADAAAYRVQVPGKTKTGETIIREKGLQHNAVIGWAVIYNPPAEVCARWTREQYDKFFHDCRSCMAEISPLFRADNLMMSAVHWDEGVPPEADKDPDRHLHDLGICKDQDGHYCGSLIDAKLLIKINTEFPKKMRSHGWDMDDLDTTDFDRAKTDNEYRTERNVQRRQSGLSVNKYIGRRTRKNAQDMEQLLDDAVQLHEDAERQIEDLMIDVQRLRNTISECQQLQTTDADLSRKRFMENLRGKNGKDAEQMYQEYLLAQSAERKRTFDSLAEIADKYDQKYGATDLNSVKRQAGE